jgi:hypothetical protein
MRVNAPRLSKLDAAGETNKNAELAPVSCASVRHAEWHRDKPRLPIASLRTSMCEGT